MPCYEAPPSQKEIDYYQKIENTKKYGINWTNEQMDVEHFCELSRLIFQFKLQEYCSEHLIKRILEHKKEDEKKGRLWK